MVLSESRKLKLNKVAAEYSNEEIYLALLELVKELSEEKVNLNESKKKLYYISAGKGGKGVC